MAISSTVKRYMEDRHVPYELVYHPRTYTAHDAAAHAHIPEAQLAKGVVLKDAQGYLEAVLPADEDVALGVLATRLGRSLDLASEGEVEHLFGDCALGAVPALGHAFGVETVVDERLGASPHVYFEAGDHEHLVHLHGASFRDLTGDLVQGRFGRHH